MSPRRNRVTPWGDLVATPLRGAWTGNRGILHRGDEIVRFHTSDRWIVCALTYRDHRAAHWAPGRWTPLFFHDEAVALAAGHRPCALCRRPAFEAFRTAWATATGGPVPTAGEMDDVLHGQRVVRGTHRRRTHVVGWPDLVPGAFVVLDGAGAAAGDVPALVRPEDVVPWSWDRPDAPAGYGAPRRRPRSGTVRLLTPPASLAVLRAGYALQVGASAGA